MVVGLTGHAGVSLRLLHTFETLFFGEVQRAGVDPHVSEKSRAEPSMRYLSRQMIAHVRESRSNWDHGAWILIIIASAFERGSRLFTVSAFSSPPSRFLTCLSRNAEQGSTSGKAVEIAVGEMEERDGGAPLPGVTPWPLRTTPGLIMHGDRLIHDFFLCLLLLVGNRWCAPNIVLFW